MAKNKEPGNGRVGAVRDRSQVLNQKRKFGQKEIRIQVNFSTAKLPADTSKE